MLGALVVGGFVSLTIAVRSLQRAQGADAGTDVVLTDSFLLEKSVLDLETGVRGYLLTGEPALSAALPPGACELFRREQPARTGDRGRS